MKKVFETVIDKGGFDLSVMLSRIDSYHVCTAPAGTVCTWNTDEYPAYWSIE